MKNTPKIIYLNIGEELSEVDDFNDCEGVTWSKEGVYMDIPYASISLLKKAFEAGMDSAAQYERGNGQLESFKEWLKKMELDNEKHR